jgi:negative regulator of flagellin synthesis FlgM
VSSKIGGVASTSTTALGTGRANTQRSSDAAGSGTQASGGSGSSSPENVEISGGARSLASLEQAVKDMPAVDTAKVAQLSTAIEQGTYTVNSQHIADRLMQMDKELSRLPSTQDADAESETETAE